jgi:hypothetical protein
VRGMGGGGGLRVSANEYSCAHHVTLSPNKLWRSNSIFNLWVHPMHPPPSPMGEHVEMAIVHERKSVSTYVGGGGRVGPKEDDSKKGAGLFQDYIPSTPDLYRKVVYGSERNSVSFLFRKTGGNPTKQWSFPSCFVFREIIFFCSKLGTLVQYIAAPRLPVSRTDILERLFQGTIETFFRLEDHHLENFYGIQGKHF